MCGLLANPMVLSLFLPSNWQAGKMPGPSGGAECLLASQSGNNYNISKIHDVRLDDFINRTNNSSKSFFLHFKIEIKNNKNNFRTTCIC